MIFGCDINFLGSIASIVGALISIGTLLYANSIDGKIKNLTKKVLFKTRVSPLKTELDNSASKISRLINDYSNSKDEIKTELSLCKASIKSIIPKLPTENQSEFKKVEGLINSILKGDIVDKKGPSKQFLSLKLFNKKQFVKDDIWSIYHQLVYSTKIVDNLVKDKKVI